ncbi:MAG TPA: hypothetical protein VES42_24180 [Pilimelia sp.]|nr:hypothetical protein [Pilimelia sp.]
MARHRGAAGVRLPGGESGRRDLHVVRRPAQRVAAGPAAVGARRTW